MKGLGGFQVDNKSQGFQGMEFGQKGFLNQVVMEIQSKYGQRVMEKLKESENYLFEFIVVFVGLMQNVFLGIGG